jgi:arsenate reductase
VYFLGNDREEIRLMKIYSYSKCGTCRNAIKDLEAKKIKFEVIDITENPPSKNVLKSAVKAKGLQKLFNTSGVQYRELKIKDKLKSMTEAQAIDLLASNGRLIKRPIVVDKDKITVGFNVDEYKQVWGK